MDKDKVEVVNRNTNKRYEVSKNYYDSHKNQYKILNPPKKQKSQVSGKLSGEISSADLDRQIKATIKDIELPKKTLSQLTQIHRQKISAQIDKLIELGKQAKQKGQNASDYNLCNITIPGTNLYCQGNKGIPRDQMPQFKGKPIPKSKADELPKNQSGSVDTQEFFKRMLQKKGIEISQPVSVPPDRLKATQSQLVGVKVAGMSKVLDDPKHPAYSKITAPIYVSKDGYVLDGHHRWASIIAHNATNPKHQIPMKVQVIDQDIIPLVKTANAFAEKMGIRSKKASAVKEAKILLNYLLKQY